MLLLTRQPVCGRTLLDTIEHVLDFSKIKRFGQESSQSMGLVADLDISAVIEEVLEGVYAGFEFNGLSSQGLADNTRSGARNLPSNGTFAPRASSENVEEHVTVIIDIDFKDQWKFPTAAGTLKRLAMNVFGETISSFAMDCTDSLLRERFEIYPPWLHQGQA